MSLSIQQNRRLFGIEGSTAPLLQRLSFALLAVAGFALLTASIANSFRGASAEEVQIATTLGTGSLSISDAACSIDPSGTQTPYDTTNNQLEIDLLAGSIASNCLGITATTTNPNGYTLTIDGPDSGNLTLADQAITPTTGTLETPTTFTTASDASSWGFAVPSAQLKGVDYAFDPSYSILAPSNTTNTANYASVPTAPTTISRTEAENGNTANGGGASTGDHYDFFFAASAGENVPTGTYTGIVTISGFGNVTPPPPDIQTFTADNCPTTRTMVRDARDDHTYWIRKIPNTRSLGGSGDLCWMETNLAYAGGTSNGGVSTYGDVINDLVEGSTANSNIGASQPCYGDNTTMNANKTKCYWIPTGANPTASSTPPSESTDGGTTNQQYGYLYSYCTAMNGQAEACQTAAASQPNQQINPGNGTMYNICPAGWRLPTGEPTTGEFTKLASALGWTSGGPQSSLFANGLYMYSGDWSNGSFGSQGSSGYYWSSTVGGTASPYTLYFSSSNVNPARYDTRGNGLAVRCVADNGIYQTTEAPTGAYMQEIVGNQTVQTDRIKYHCPTTRTRVRDARNNNTYWIRRIENTNGLGDGQGAGSAMCWMETNFAYAGGTSNGGVSTYGDVINDLVEGSAINSNVGFDQPCFGDNTTMNANKTKCYWTPSGANPTSGTTNPSTSTNGTGQYGYLYSWCAAMNGQAEACQDSAASQPNQQVNPGNGTMYNICPAGWRLPTGEPTTGEFAKLATALSATSGAAGSAYLRALGLYMYSGGWSDGSFYDQGSGGYYWSSTVSNTTSAHYLFFYSNNVSPVSSSSKGYGQAVRCVVP